MVVAIYLLWRQSLAQQYHQDAKITSDMNHVEIIGQLERIPEARAGANLSTSLQYKFLFGLNAIS